jgi:hypothetical protein
VLNSEKGPHETLKLCFAEENLSSLLCVCVRVLFALLGEKDISKHINNCELELPICPWCL